MNVWEFLRGQIQLVFHIMKTTTISFGSNDFSIWDLTITLSVIAVIAAYLGFYHEEDE